MTISFAKIGFWKLLAAGMLLEFFQLALQSRIPELSAHFLGARPIGMRILLISEYCLLMATFMAAVGTVHGFYTGQVKATHPAIIIVSWVVYFALFVWVLRR
jgi:hypothetical protein